MNEGDVQFGYGPAFYRLLMPFFQLPSLRGFSANNLIDPSYLVDAENNEPTGFSTITDIDLRESCANDGMHTLISSCTALKSFKYQHSDLPLESIGYRPDRLYHALSRHKETLEVLWLDHHGTHYSYTAGGLNQTRESWIGSLADFTALQELRIPLHNLLDIQHKSSPTTPLFDCLPPSLESLYIEGCKEHQFSMLVLQLDAVFMNGDIRFPNLQRVEVEGNFLDASLYSGKIDPSTPETPGPAVSSHILLAAKTLQRGCDAAGVDLHIYHHDGPQHQIISRES
ncbi:uncharacterized protein N7484_001047 [Penicillium longicatenatum]|uniref:uncharacterized protein n=1 Tax=Penicillium longicatenatum TaxID=1561947 RepID=UPI002546C045|nr:uncharacterized protein N7484_001047 [Penicillium longicatenatum]KAJ5657398.1 hypothetical protein N7484_001047 [Penicillium longicatenatum]